MDALEDIVGQLAWIIENGVGAALVSEMESKFHVKQTPIAS